ncbi:terminase small subunit [uncultured Limosilactobacillus sp.]|uniref:terminase small subunit n=1 Tax=uncultured Limosilactobacillus sp. TaxID=2837629 RepID=UPI0025FBD258|nr:terminase small subunit [uncultured Limosilactobacillus sp.]
MSRIDNAKADYLAGMKYKDIAAKYAVALSTVKSWKTRYKWQRNNATKKKSTHTKAKSMRTNNKKVAPSLSPPKLPDNKQLNDKQKFFCLFYLQRYNATWAYQQAYGGSYDTARTNGPRLLANACVKKYLTALKEQQANDLYVTANDIMMRYLRQATSDITDVLSFRTEKHLAYYKVRDKTGPYQDSQGHFRYVPKIDPETKEQAVYYENIVELKNSDQIDTSNIKSVRIDKGEAVVEMEDRQKAMKELLNRLEPSNKDSDVKIVFKDDLKPDKGGENGGADT